MIRADPGVGTVRTPTRPEPPPSVGEGAAGRMGGLTVRSTKPVISAPPPPGPPPTALIADRQVRALPPSTRATPAPTTGAGLRRTDGAPADNRRLLDPTTLKREMGRNPGLFSTRYKAVLKPLAEFQKASAEPIATDPKPRQAQVAKLTKLLDDATTAAIAHHKAHKDAPMKSLISELRQQKLVLNNLELSAPPGTTFKTMLAAGGSGMPDQAYRDFATDNPQNETSPREILGKGQINTAYKVSYGGEAMVFKPMPTRDPDMAAAPKTIGIDPERPRYANRNVATAVIDRAMGSGTAPGTHFARDGDKVGIVMEQVKGKSPTGLDYSRNLLLSKPPDGADPNLKAAYRAEQSRLETLNDLDCPEAEKTSAAAMGYAVHPETGEWGRFNNLADQFDRRDPVLMRGLSRLEWMDKVCGQVDRHPGNYLIDQQPNPAPPPPNKVVGVKGIDNDFSFGAAHTDVRQRAEGFKDVALPVLIDSETYASLRTMQAEWNAPGGKKAELEALLTPGEVAATKARLDALVTHAESVERAGRVVPADSWDTWRSGVDGRSAYEISTANQDASYLGRLEALASHRIGTPSA